ncbi:hypothetical protein [uncultured Flavobacterium sp.]|uniref:hypothetical protein n=1 Tax=uncultured Flavobacterium sp. TaxID=165435 RepID=UPI0030EEA3EF|tara:strand:+ start:19781 stop:20224 length:444 start_codon:yes stop_codon:yes gene_type:complete
MNKKSIIKKIIEEQENVISQLEKSVLMYSVSSDIDEDDVIDPEDFSHQNEAKEMQLRYEQMLIQAKKNKDFLLSIQNNKCNSIQVGALIETDELYIFIGISIPQFELNNKNVISISDQAPIYNDIKDKNVGDIVSLASYKNKILNIS